jgi:hypothetical protein
MLMHSDRRVTDQVYLDTSLINLTGKYEVDRRVPKMNTHFRQNGHLGSWVGEKGEEGENVKEPVNNEL